LISNNKRKEDAVSLYSHLLDPWFRIPYFASPVIVWGLCRMYCSLSFNPASSRHQDWKRKMPRYEWVAANTMLWHLSSLAVLTFVYETLKQWS
jgi:hypothetical protein